MTEHPEFKKRHAELKEQVESVGLEEPEIRELAEQAGLITLYNLAYRTLSHENAHSSGRSLLRYFNFSSSTGQVASIQASPDVTELETVIFLGSACVVVAMECLAKVFTLGTSEIEIWKENLRRLSEHMPDMPVMFGSWR